MPEKTHPQKISLDQSSQNQPNSAEGLELLSNSNETTENQKQKSIFDGNKGLIVAIILAVIVAIIGLSSFFSSNNSENYQGMIRQIEQQTRTLNN